jgi:hypothetical protein
MKGRSFGASMDTCRLLGDADLAYAVKKKRSRNALFVLEGADTCTDRNQGFKLDKEVKKHSVLPRKVFLWVGR